MAEAFQGGEVLEEVEVIAIGVQAIEIFQEADLATAREIEKKEVEVQGATVEDQALILGAVEIVEEVVAMGEAVAETIVIKVLLNQEGQDINFHTN